METLGQQQDDGSAVSRTANAMLAIFKNIAYGTETTVHLITQQV